MNATVSINRETGKIISPITCKPNSSLGDVIHTLSTQCVHRIYTVNDEGEVVGVITLRDVISCFITEPSYHFDDYFGFAVEEMLQQRQ